MKRKTSLDNKCISEQIPVIYNQPGIEKDDEVIELSSDLEENDQKIDSFNETSTNIKSCKIIF